MRADERCEAVGRGGESGQIMSHLAGWIFYYINIQEVLHVVIFRPCFAFAIVGFNLIHVHMYTSFVWVSRVFSSQQQRTTNLSFLKLLFREHLYKKVVCQ